MKKKIFAILLIVWMGFIFSMSSQDATLSSNTSGGTIRMALTFLSPNFAEQDDEVKDEIVENLQMITRKSAHFVAYMIIGILSILLFLQYDKLNHPGLLAFLFSATYAISDEIHQLFVPGRSGEIRDVLIDSIGAALGIILIILIYSAMGYSKDNKEVAQ